MAGLPDSYPYLLGMYLGDGCIATHPRGVYKLRITLDLKYPALVGECAAAMQDAVPANRVYRLARLGRAGVPTHVDVLAYSKTWPCLFPQHGPGRKHQRTIALEGWQLELVQQNPQGLLRGLIHSDGCRFINTGTNWAHPRYAFTNYSEDILGIFIRACELIDVRYTHAPRTVYVSRKADVGTLDGFIGPKR